jgi:tellurite resistance protein TerC
MLWLWAGFLALIFLVLAIDLGIVGRSHKEMSARLALRWTGVFVGLGALFNVAIYFLYSRNLFGAGDHFAAILKATGDPDHAASHSVLGGIAAMQFLAGWLTEYSLSVDNLFVIALIFKSFSVQREDQHRVLFWGILGAMIARAAMILAGAAAVQRFEWVLYGLGAFLLFTAWKVAFSVERETQDFSKSLTVRLARRVFHVTDDYHGHRFFTRLPSGALAATPLFIVLLIVEVTDVVFAVDSIPAVIGITRDPFLVFTSNIFAILGLRSLFFALRSMMDRFHALKHALAAILAFVGAKMLLEGAHHLRPLADKALGSLPRWLGWLPKDHIEIPAGVSLGVILLVLATGAAISVLTKPPHKAAE